MTETECGALTLSTNPVVGRERQGVAGANISLSSSPPTLVSVDGGKQTASRKQRYKGNGAPVTRAHFKEIPTLGESQIIFRSAIENRARASLSSPLLPADVFMREWAKAEAANKSIQFAYNYRTRSQICVRDGN